MRAVSRLSHAACAALIAAALAAASTPASAQMLGVGWGYGPPVPPRGLYLAGPPPHAAMPHTPLPHAYHGPHFLPPGAAIALLRRQGFREAGPLALRGETLVVAATEVGLGGGPVTVVMDAYDGEVLRVVPRRLTDGPAFTGPLPRARAEPSRSQAGAPLPPARPRHIAAATPAGSASAPSASAASRPLPVYPPAEPDVFKKLTRPAD